MLPLPQLVAYPMLLVAIYAIYRIGRAGRKKSERFEWVRLAALATLLGVVMALQVRFVASGYVRSPIAMIGATLSIAGVFGLVGVNLLDIVDARRARNARTFAHANATLAYVSRPK